MFVAIIAKAPLDTHEPKTVVRSGVTGEDRAAVIQAALSTRDQWESKNGQGPYRIYVGQLVSEVVIPTRYEEIPI